jgi:hypothetical protein
MTFGFIHAGRKITLHNFTSKRFELLYTSKSTAHSALWAYDTQLVIVTNMKPKYSPHCSQNPATGPHTGLDKSTPHLHIFSQTHFNILSLRFSIKIFAYISNFSQM